MQLTVHVKQTNKQTNKQTRNNTQFTGQDTLLIITQQMVEQ